MRPAWTHLSLVIALLSCAAASADEVYLKGGGRVSGRIVQRTETTVEVEVGVGKVAVRMSQVERIVEGSSSLDVYDDRARALGANDRAGWAALGRWASDQGLSAQSREAYRRVLAIDPSDAEANRALGRVQVDGRWVAEEESYRARGFVQFEGEWMAPAEQQAIQQQRSQADADRARAQSDARARQAEARAQEAEDRAKTAEAARREAEQGLPLWWGWGPGPVLWPAPPVNPSPPQPPARPRQ
jgi:hypothetical protein